MILFYDPTKKAKKGCGRDDYRRVQEFPKSMHRNKPNYREVEKKVYKKSYQILGRDCSTAIRLVKS